ncbi:MAG: glycosyltransferase family 2 protein [Hydrogenimonas sp.]|nr:glycosyltransferase family 2 protein [Hydrogenimonas sp.]
MQNRRPHISVVTPVYGCARALPELYERLVETLSQITKNFEIIMVNDQSPDEAWKIIIQLAAKDPRVKGINLSRNFGQHRAITAGLDFADGEWVVVMDCDLQDQPEEIIKLYNKAQEGYDVVFGRRAERKDSFLKKLSSKLFYTLFKFISGMEADGSTANFSIISHKVVNAFRNMREQNRGYAPFIFWLGFKRANIDIEHAQRPHGKSSYSLRKLIALAVDSIVAHSNKPLRLSIEFGFLMTFLSLAYALWLVIRYFAFGVPVAGWTSVMVSIYLIGGLLFANMGILGLYIGKVFNETKNRPIYVVSETTFEKKSEQESDDAGS